MALRNYGFYRENFSDSLYKRLCVYTHESYRFTRLHSVHTADKQLKESLQVAFQLAEEM